MVTMKRKFLALACVRDLSPRPHYPSMPRGVSSADANPKSAVFSVVGMTCSACAGSVEKAVKRLPGIKEVVVDVLNDKALVLFFPSCIDVSVRQFLSFFKLDGPNWTGPI